MAENNTNSKEGFTIIEVVLVLAIAGLIFLMVFVALPSLQRSQRDTQRRNDLSRLGTALGQWQTNHGTSLNNLPSNSKWFATSTITTCPTQGAGGTNPTDDACELVRDYMNTGAQGGTISNTFADPDGSLYNIVISPNISSLAEKPTLSNPTGQNLAENVAQLTWNNNRYSLGGTDPYSAHTIFIIPGGQCDEDTVVTSENRRYAIIYRLEGAGVHCLDDQ